MLQKYQNKRATKDMPASFFCMAYGLIYKCLPLACVVEELVSRWWCCFGRLTLQRRWGPAQRSGTLENRLWGFCAHPISCLLSGAGRLRCEGQQPPAPARTECTIMPPLLWWMVSLQARGQNQTQWRESAEMHEYISLSVTCSKRD